MIHPNKKRSVLTKGSDCITLLGKTNTVGTPIIIAKNNTLMPQKTTSMTAIRPIIAIINVSEPCPANRPNNAQKENVGIIHNLFFNFAVFIRFCIRNQFTKTSPC